MEINKIKRAGCRSGERLLDERRMENTTLIGRNKGDKGNRNGSREIRVVTKESSLGGVGSHKLGQLVAISPVIQRPGANTIARSNFCDGLTAPLFASLVASALPRPYSLNCSHSRMSRWFVPERLVRAYKSQPGAVTRVVAEEENKAGIGGWRTGGRRRGEVGAGEEEKSRERERVSKREREEEGEKRFPQSDPPACSPLRASSLRSRSRDPRDAGPGKKRAREREAAGPKGASEFLILRNRRRIPERFHSPGPGPGISLAPFPGTPGARVNGGLAGYSPGPFSLSLSRSPPP